MYLYIPVHTYVHGGRERQTILPLSLVTPPLPPLSEQLFCIAALCPPHLPASHLSMLPLRRIGRCHAASLVGSKLVLFGGSLDMGNSVTWLDLDSLMWGQPLVLGSPPPSRMSAVMVQSGCDLLVYGGWIFSRGEVWSAVLVTFIILLYCIGWNYWNIWCHHHHHQKAFRNKSHTSHGHRPGLKRNKSKGKRLTIN